MKQAFSRTFRLCSGLMLGAVLLTQTADAKAEESTATGKGIAGGALLGGELVTFIEGLAGVQSTWAYGGGFVLGAAAGGVGGYFVEQGADRRVSFYMLAGGLSLVIPTTIWVLNATSYKAPAGYQEDKAPPAAEPVAEPPRPGAPAPAPGPKSDSGPQRPAAQFRWHGELPSTRAAIPTSMVDVTHDGALRFSVPAVELRPMYTQAEMRQFGVSQREEFRIPVFGGSF